MQQHIMTHTANPLPAVLTDAMMTSLGLSNTDLPAIQELASRIQVSSPSSVAEFGQEASMHSVTLADDLLMQVRSSDLDGAGEKLNEVVSIARSINLGPLSDRRSRLPFIGQYIDKLRLKAANVVGNLDTAKNQITTLLSEVETTQNGLSDRNAVLEDMFSVVKEEHHNLGLHIAAGRLKLAELQSISDEMQQYALTDPTKAQEFSDINATISKLDKRVGDLSALQHSALQSLPMIRMVQSNNQMLVDKFHTIKSITVPAWQRQLALRIALNEQQNAAALTKSIDDTTNYLLLENAKLLKENSIQTARSNQRLVIDVETLESVQAILISAVSDVKKIQLEGIELRKNAELQIEKLRVGLVTSMKSQQKV